MVALWSIVRSSHAQFSVKLQNADLTFIVSVLRHFTELVLSISSVDYMELFTVIMLILFIVFVILWLIKCLYIVL